MDVSKESGMEPLTLELGGLFKTWYSGAARYYVDDSSILEFDEYAHVRAKKVGKTKLHIRAYGVSECIEITVVDKL